MSPRRMGKSQRAKRKGEILSQDTQIKKFQKQELKTYLKDGEITTLVKYRAEVWQSRDKAETKLQKAMSGRLRKTCSRGYEVFLNNSTKNKVVQNAKFREGQRESRWEGSLSIATPPFFSCSAPCLTSSLGKMEVTPGELSHHPCLKPQNHFVFCLLS